MRFSEIITESEGGIIRRAQEVKSGKTIAFAKGDDVLTLVDTFIVPEKEDKLPSKEELQLAIDQVVKANKASSMGVYGNIPMSGGAALLTFWKNSAGKLVVFTKISQRKKPGAFPITWTNSEFGKETGYSQTGSKIAERAQFKIKPNELFATDRDISIVGLSSSIKSRPDLPPEVEIQMKQLLKNVETGKKVPVAGAEKYATTYEVDFGESAAPIALATGNFVSGNYQEAEDNLLKPLGLTWRSIKSVIFPGSGANNLYDSYLKLDKNNTLRVSSKDKKGGAAAAVTGLVKDIQNNPERFSEVTAKRNYQKILKLVETIAENRADTGPLIIAVNLGIIDQQDMNTIRSLLGQGIKYNSRAKWLTPNLKNLFKRKGAKFDDPAYDVGYHLLACVAELVADHLNSLPGISDFFKAILERSNMVQVKSNIETSAKGATFSNFQVIYPPVFKGIIKVVAGNNYMATRKPIGKISFKI